MSVFESSILVPGVVTPLYSALIDSSFFVTGFLEGFDESDSEEGEEEGGSILVSLAVPVLLADTAMPIMRKMTINPPTALPKIVKISCHIFSVTFFSHHLFLEGLCGP